MPTNDEINAGVIALKPDLQQVVQSFIPMFFQGSAMQSLQSEQGQAIIRDGVRRVLIAAEAVRAKVTSQRMPAR